MTVIVSNRFRATRPPVGRQAVMSSVAMRTYVRRMVPMAPSRRLVPGHIHQAMRLGGMQIAIIWPSTLPGRWHVGLTTSVRWASHDPVVGDRVFDLLRTWGFDVNDCETWRHWQWTGPCPRGIRREGRWSATGRWIAISARRPSRRSGSGSPSAGGACPTTAELTPTAAITGRARDEGSPAGGRCAERSGGQVPRTRPRGPVPEGKLLGIRSSLPTTMPGSVRDPVPDLLQHRPTWLSRNESCRPAVLLADVLSTSR